MCRSHTQVGQVYKLSLFEYSLLIDLLKTTKLVDHSEMHACIVHVYAQELTEIEHLTFIQFLSQTLQNKNRNSLTWHSQANDTWLPIKQYSIDWLEHFKGKNILFTIDIVDISLPA